MISWIVMAMVGGIFVGGLVCMALPLRWWLRARRRMRLGGVADGWVVALRPQASGPDPESYVTIFQFNDRRGGSHRVSASVAHSPAQHAIGDRVLVAYEPDRPENAEIVADTSTLGSLALLGLFLSVIALLLWWGLWIGAFVLEPA
jgi:Protein of unknown function (DUF3592)